MDEPKVMTRGTAERHIVGQNESSTDGQGEPQVGVVGRRLVAGIRRHLMSEVPAYGFIGRSAHISAGPYGISRRSLHHLPHVPERQFRTLDLYIPTDSIW